jgi:CheY-like chemotaxis protein
MAIEDKSELPSSKGSSRREFLKRSTLGAALAIVAPQLALPSPFERQQELHSGWKIIDAPSVSVPDEEVSKVSYDASHWHSIPTMPATIGGDIAKDGEAGFETAPRRRVRRHHSGPAAAQERRARRLPDLRQHGGATPILMLTARAQELDKVLGLKVGADDYLTQPFDMLELLARIQALLRRPAAGAATRHTYQIDAVRVDVRSTTVWRDGKKVPLSAREFQLLRYLV